MQEFETLLNQHQRDIFCYIRSITGNTEASWDLLQETNLALWERREKFQTGKSFLAWSFPVARNKAIDYFRSLKKESVFLDRATAEMMADEIDRNFVSEQFRPAEKAALEHCLEQLNPEHRAVLKDYYEHNMSVAALSDLQSTSENALKQLLFRLRRRLRDCIDLQLNQNHSSH